MRARLLIALLPALAGAPLGCRATSAPAASPPPNVIILNIDMLRADHLGVHGYVRPTTPNLDEIARRGVWFTRARSATSWTYPSVASLFTGLHPSSHGARYTQAGDRYFTTALAPALRTITMTLDEHGYTTAAFVTNPILKRFSGLDRGFDVYRDDFVKDWHRDRPESWWLEAMSAEHVHRELLAWLDGQPQPPLFLYAHYIDVHGPYLPPRPFGRPGLAIPQDHAEAARLGGIPNQLAVDLYDGALQYLDARLGELMRELERRGLLERSIVIVTSDHGEEFEEHDGHGHGHTLYEELIHVPLMMARTAALPHTRRIDHPVAQVDLFATLTDLLGLPPPVPTAGTSLRPLIEGQERLPGYAILAELDNRGRPAWNDRPGAPDLAYALLVEPATKYVLWTPRPFGVGGYRGYREELYDLATDPGETRNVAAPGPVLNQARKLAAERIGRAQAAASAPATAPMDPATRERLRSLGYVH